jgi:predicted membrane protein
MTRTRIIFYTGVVVGPALGLAALVSLVRGDLGLAARLGIGAGVATVVWSILLARLGDPSTLSPRVIDFKRFGETLRWW